MKKRIWTATEIRAIAEAHHIAIDKFTLSSIETLDPLDEEAIVQLLRVHAAIPADDGSQE